METKETNSHVYSYWQYAKPIGKTRYSFNTYKDDVRDNILFFDSYGEAYSEWLSLSSEEKDTVIDYVVGFETNVAPFAFEGGVIDPYTGKRITQYREGKNLYCKISRR